MTPPDAAQLNKQFTEMQVSVIDALMGRSNAPLDGHYFQSL